MNFKGFVQVYTGDGKGKTTAALGLILRALGAGFKVALVQFLKKGVYSEIKALERFRPQIEIYQFHQGGFIKGEPRPEVKEVLQRGWLKAQELILNRAFQLVVLDEINLVLHLDLIPLKEVLETLAQRPSHVEVVLTGRNAPEALLEAADLVTEMRKVKHYYDRGVKARVGIEK